ncbi:transcription initiation factor IIF subunit alpha [Iris pallida]|uniref:Transcription initiation factor IIF subunit alpha n=1 Tax=Iris pallida TaxID=29817 RepID=A0AAX6DJ06_IRIPA|nr:transcription initiation factor IIF subunit alpha [Iris pallida]KAJ6853442.1 transcription initiation factor IIF subunit alpha [Iris pallida]
MMRPQCLMCLLQNKRMPLKTSKLTTVLQRHHPMDLLEGHHQLPNQNRRKKSGGDDVKPANTAQQKKESKPSSVKDEPSSTAKAGTSSKIQLSYLQKLD